VASVQSEPVAARICRRSVPQCLAALIARQGFNGPLLLSRYLLSATLLRYGGIHRDSIAFDISNCLA